MKVLDHKEQRCDRPVCLVCAIAELTEGLVAYSLKERAQILALAWLLPTLRKALGRKDVDELLLGDNVVRQLTFIWLPLVEKEYEPEKLREWCAMLVRTVIDRKIPGDQDRDPEPEPEEMLH